jgi:hypothetical protein
MKQFTVCCCAAVAFFLCTVIRTQSGDAAFGTQETFWTRASRSVLEVHCGQAFCDRDIVLHNKHNRQYSHQHCAVAALICARQLQLCRITS